MTSDTAVMIGGLVASVALIVASAVLWRAVMRRVLVEATPLWICLILGSAVLIGILTSLLMVAAGIWWASIGIALGVADGCSALFYARWRLIHRINGGVRRLQTRYPANANELRSHRWYRGIAALAGLK